MLIEELEELEKKEKELKEQAEQQEEETPADEPTEESEPEEVVEIEVETDDEPTEDPETDNDEGSDETQEDEVEAKSNNELNYHKRKAQEAEDKLKAMETLIAQQSQNFAPQATQPQEQADPEPDKAYDYEAWSEWKIRQQDNELAQLKAQQQQYGEQVQYQQAKNAMDMIERQYSVVKSDYNDALEFLRQKTMARVKYSNPQLNETQVEAQVEAMKLQEANNAVQRGLNPAEYFYRLAEIDGYAPSAPTPVEKPSGPDLDAIAKNQKKSANLMNGSSRSKTTGKLDLSSVQGMTLEQAAQTMDSWDTK